VVFSVGPFDDRSEAEALVEALKAAGAENVTLEETSAQ
jgi:hypothetical protein